MIAPTLLDDVLDNVAIRAGKPDEALIRQLRETFSGVHFSVCSDDDMPHRLSCAAENPHCRLSGEHCLSLTTDAESATGLVVALVDQGE